MYRPLETAIGLTDRKLSMKNTLLASLLALLSGCAMAGGDEQTWELVFADPGSGDWQESWFVEGLKAKVNYDDDGALVFSSGPVPKENASHAVLWTRQVFRGDVRIEYDYTRLDSMTDVNSVNILYIQATGLGTEEFPTDILLSTKKREVPWMKYYFLNMNTLHVSYATTGPIRSHYVGARRYPAIDEAHFEEGTKIQPVYQNVDLFQPGETYHIMATKVGNRLTFTAEREGKTYTFEWDTSSFPHVSEGRIGLRHMWARSSRYENFRVLQKKYKGHEIRAGSIVDGLFNRLGRPGC